MNQLFHKLRESILTALVLLAAFSGNSQAETVWSTGGTYSEGGTITDGLTITASDAINITGKYTVSGVLGAGGDQASIRLFGAGTVTVKNGGELTIQAETGTQSGLTAYPGANLTVESGATMNITTNGERVRFSRGTTTLNDGNTTVNWAGNGTWDLGGNYFFSLTSASNGRKATFNIGGGSLNIKNAKMYMAFGSENYWNITGGTLTVGEGNNEVVFGGGDWNASATTTGKILVNGGTFNVRGSGEWTWGKQNGSTPSNLTLDLKIQSGTFSTSRSITQNTNIATRNETITLAGGTFDVPNLSDQKKTKSTLSVASGIATSLTASSTFNVDQNTVLNYESAITGPTTAPTESSKVTLTKTGAGTLRLTSDSNALTNVSLDLKDGWVGISSQDEVHDVAFNGGALALMGTEAATFNLTYTQTAALKLGNVGDLTLSGNMDFSTYGLVKSGTGTMYLTGSNTNKENGIQVNEGVLAITDAKNVGGSSQKNVVFLNGGTLRVTGDVTLNSIFSSSGTVEVSGANSRLYLKTEGLNPFNSGSVHKTGAGLLEIALNEDASNGALPVTTYLDEGTIKIHREKTLSGNKTVEMKAGTTFQFAGGYETASAKFDVKGNATLEILGDRTLNFDGIVTGSEGVTITKAGPATMKLSSGTANAASILVSAGNLELAKSGGAAAVNLTFNDGTNLLVSAQNQFITGGVTLNSGSTMQLKVTESDAYSSFAAKTLNVKDGAKIEIAFNDEMDPFALGTLELLTADEYQVNGTKLTTQDEMNEFLKNYVTLNSNWAQMTVVPTGTGYAFAVQADFNKIPEPATWVLLLLGISVLGFKELKTKSTHNKF